MRGRLRAVVAATLCALTALTACTSTQHPAPHPTTTPVRPPSSHPNIVFVLTDDLSTDLVQYMPHVQAMMSQGLSFTNYTVTNSLCCPSRASIFTGEFPHNTGVETNDPPDGGWAGFVKHGDENRTFAVALQRAGYRTGFMGKYLNGYDPTATRRNPPGWTSWDGVNGAGYGGYGYIISADGRLERYGTAPSDYLTTVLASKGRSFIRTAATSGKPFALEVATFAPHDPYTPAPADRNTFLNLPAPRTPAFDTVPRNAPSWLASHKPLTRDQIAVLDEDFRRRVESVQSVDRLIEQLQNTLRETGQLANTVFVFSSDNGLHLGQYRMTAGKLTAFDTDIKVPLVVTGPGIAPNTTNAAPVENIDLAPTFEQLAGAPVPATVDGRSIVPLLHGASPPWRSWALVEHGAASPPSGDPDVQPRSSGYLGAYRAIRSARYTYVEYRNGEREYYDRLRDPYQLDNVYRTLSPARVAELHSIVADLSGCVGAAQCWRAARPTLPR